MLWPFGSTWRPVRQTRRGTVDLWWLTARMWTTKWYPQGIDLGVWDGRRALAVSWFRQDKDRQHLASRISLIDLERSRHLDIALAIDDGGGELAPAPIHAGGLAWFEDRLFVAATGQGVWEFDLAAIRRVRGSLARRLTGGHRRGLPAVALVAVRSRVHSADLRCSFLGRVFDEAGEPLQRVLIGEYRTDDEGRVGEFSIPHGPDDGFDCHDEIAPSIPRMQGAVRWGDRYFVSQSSGPKRPGTLWRGARDALQPDGIPLPVGCEDLALDPEARMLWSLGEHPWRRVVRGIPFAWVGLRAQQPGDTTVD